MAQKLLTLNQGKVQRVSIGSGTIGAIDPHEVTIPNDKTICKILYGSATLNSGEKYQFLLNSNLITVDSIFFQAVLQCESGFPILTKIEFVTTGQAVVEILNIGAQSVGTQDIVSKDISITLMIL